MDGDGGGPKHPQQLFFDNVSPATRLLEKRRQMYEVQDALENQKARFEKDEDQFRKKEEHLRMKDLHLQHQLFKFNKFLQDNEAKRRRADTRAAEEAQQIKQREEEIQDLERQLEESKRSCSELEEEVSRNMKYEAFLERVKGTCEDYPEITDLLTRYDTLEIANRDLRELQSEKNASIEKLRSTFQSYRKEQEMEMLELTNRIATLSQERDDTANLRLMLEQQVDDATQEDSKHSLFFGRILMSVENLFLRCTTKRSNIHHDDEFSRARDGGEPEEQEDTFRRKQQIAIRELKVILAYLRDFKDMVEQLRRTCRTTQGRQASANDAVQAPDPKIEFEAADPEPRGGAADRGSQHSGSQANTRDLARSGREATSGSAGD